MSRLPQAGIAALLAAPMPSVHYLVQQTRGAGDQRRDINLPNGYMQYSQELDIVTMSYQLRCFKFRYRPADATARPPLTAGKRRRRESNRP